MDCHLLLGIDGFLTPSSLNERRQIRADDLIYSLITVVLVLSVKPFGSREFPECFLNRGTFPNLHTDIHQQVKRVTVMSAFIACDARTKFPSK